ncbi:MAG TPA: NAD(P)H-dependent oxidoreductase subunit E [Candidatus Sulfotelmatobacter sp.]|nr:NAD(P)H-dependent oxidoreductase subunit E [Candidatus Sulfotelmatobacter sp.]
MSTQADAAIGVHPGSDAVADWSPHLLRPGHPFDELYARLRPEIDATLAQYEQKRSALLPMAHLFQEHEGYVSANAVAVIAHTLEETLATVESTLSFYTLFFRRPVGKYMVQVCRNLSCLLNGAQEILDHCRAKIGVAHLETTDDGVFSYEEVECLAACDRAPCAQVNLEFVYDLTKEKVDQLLADLRAGTHAIQPLAQTVKPGRTWKVAQDTGLKAPGARGVSDPNNAGGIGDPSGITMFDLIVGKPQYEERSKERLVHETTLRPELAEDGHH